MNDLKIEKEAKRSESPEEYLKRLIAKAEWKRIILEKREKDKGLKGDGGGP